MVVKKKEEHLLKLVFKEGRLLPYICGQKDWRTLSYIGYKEGRMLPYIGCNEEGRMLPYVVGHVNGGMLLYTGGQEEWRTLSNFFFENK